MIGISYTFHILCNGFLFALTFPFLCHHILTRFLLVFHKITLLNRRGYGGRILTFLIPLHHLQTGMGEVIVMRIIPSLLHSFTRSFRNGGGKHKETEDGGVRPRVTT